MDRGIVHQNIRMMSCDIQVCRLDLADPGSPCLFLTACEPPSGDDIWTAPGPDSPVEMNDPDRLWPEVAGVADLDRLIAALQAEREWIAEHDPQKRKSL